MMSLDGKTGSNLVNIYGRSDSLQRLNPDNNLVTDTGTFDLSPTINVPNMSSDLITAGYLKLGSVGTSAVLAHKNHFGLTGFAIARTSGGQTSITSATNRIRAYRTLDIQEHLNVSYDINASSINTFSANILTINNYR